MAHVLIAADDEREARRRTSAAPPRVTTGVVGDGCAAELGLRDEDDLMILDVGFAGRDGCEVLEALRAARCRIRVLVLTGPGNPGNAEACLDPAAAAQQRRRHRTTHHSW